MKTNFISFLLIVTLTSCITTKDVEQLSRSQVRLYPIGINGKWGFADKTGATVILPTYQKVSFFHRGLAVVQHNDKFGYLRADGNWHIRPKYDSATSFVSNCASVTKNNKSYLINQRGRKAGEMECYPAAMCAMPSIAADPQNYVVKREAHYELIYKQIPYQLADLSIAQLDTTIVIAVDSVKAFNLAYIVIYKDGKCGLHPIDRLRPVAFDATTADLDLAATAAAKFISRINFPYKDLESNLTSDHAASYAKVKINGKWGLINGQDKMLIPPNYSQLELHPSQQLVLVEYAPDHFGYMSFRGEVYFEEK
ncbi:MAG: WG repeat-containing protein [Saprospiraceae bacterium]